MHRLTADPEFSVTGITSVRDNFIFRGLKCPSQAAVYSLFKFVPGFGRGDARLRHAETADGRNSNAVKEAQLVLRNMAAADDELLDLRAKELAVNVGKHLSRLSEASDRICFLQMQ